MDDAAIRALALSIAQNRTPSDTVEAEATKLYDWMIARGDPGVQCIVAANNKVISQDNVDGVIASATDNYAFLTGGDGSPVMPWPPVVEHPPPPMPPPDPLVFGMNRDALEKMIMGITDDEGRAVITDEWEARTIAHAIFARTPLMAGK